MADRSKIEWTDASWNPLRVTRLDDGRVGWHCEKVSPACDHCYAETHNGRELPAGGTGLPYVRGSRDAVTSFVDEEVLLRPFAWKRRRKIFVCSMTDLFGDWVSDSEIAQVFAVAYSCQWHTFQFLTKRVARMARLLNCVRFRALVARQAYEIGIRLKPEMEGVVTPEEMFDDVCDLWPLANAWIGATVEDQKRADVRIPSLLACPAAIHFVSYEPALEPVDFAKFDGIYGLSWIICGGESGSQARWTHPAWVKQCRDYCIARRIPFFFKQWGTWQPANHGPIRSMTAVRVDQAGRDVTGLSGLEDETDEYFYRVGKVKAGRSLGGREWSQFPEVQHG